MMDTIAFPKCIGRRLGSVANGVQKVPDAFPMFHRWAGFWLVFIMLWTAATMLLACQGYLGKIIYPGETPRAIQASGLITARASSNGEVQNISKRQPFSYYFIREAEVWYTRAALSPMALWIALRFRIRSASWARMVFVHLLTS